MLLLLLLLLFLLKIHTMGEHSVAQYSATVDVLDVLYKIICTRGDRKVCEKVLLNHIAFIDCNENSQTETVIFSKLIEIKI